MKSKKKCLYCGNNPTNHFMSYVMQSIAIPLTPVIRVASLLENRVTFFIAKVILTPYLHFFRLVRFIKWNKDKTKACTDRSLVIWTEAEARNIPMEQLVIMNKPVEHYRAKISNRWNYFESLPIPKTLKGRSYAWMDDKGILKKTFLKAGIKTPRGGSVMTWKQAEKMFHTIDKPVIIKPQLGSRGRHTLTNLRTLEELQFAYRIAKQLCHFVVIEEHLVGSVYRGTYVGGKIVGILRGDPPRILGDGKKTIRELIENKNKTKPEKIKEVIINKKLEDFLERQAYTLDSILEKDKTIDVNEKIGTSYGGFAAEMIPVTHPKILTELKKAGDLLNAPVIGFDFIINDVTKDPDTQKWGIIEANSLPFINLHHFPLEGDAVNVASKVWDLWK